MKKSTKKCASLLLAAILMFSFAVSAFAEGGIVAVSEAGEGPGVMVNGELLEFSDAQPEYSNDRTMIPVRALMEALGAEVDYEESVDGEETVRTVIIKLADATISFVIGEMTATVTDAEGESSVIEMDCASYEKDDRTYVPLRFASEAAGYDVFWDSSFKTAIIIDKKAVIEELDKKFEKLNALMAFEATPIEGNLAVGVDMNMTYVLPDGTMEVNANANGINGALASDIKMTMDMTSSGAYEEIPEEVGSLLTALREKGMEVIVNMETGVYYVKFPSEMISAIQPGLSGDIWMSLDINAFLESMLGQSIAELESTVETTFGGILYDMVMSMSGDSIYAYEVLMAQADAVTSVLENLNVTDDGFDLVMGLEDIEAMLPESDLFDVFEINVSGTADGAGKGKIVIADATLSLEMVFDVDALGNGTISFVLEVPEEITVSMDMEMTVAKTNEEPRQAPPEGAVIVDIIELISGGSPMPMLPVM